MGKDTFELGGREWPKIKWWKMKGMRSVYFTLWAALITSATNGRLICLLLALRNGVTNKVNPPCIGYDGSLMNGLEAMDTWIDSEILLPGDEQRVRCISEPWFKLANLSIQPTIILPLRSSVSWSLFSVLAASSPHLWLPTLPMESDAGQVLLLAVAACFLAWHSSLSAFMLLYSSSAALFLALVLVLLR